MVSASNDNLKFASFWQLSAWVELLVWVRFIFLYMSDIGQFFWINNLILSSIRATKYFLIVYIISVTAFAGSYNLIEQGIYIDRGQTNDSIDTSFRTNFESWMDQW